MRRAAFVLLLCGACDSESGDSGEGSTGATQSGGATTEEALPCDECDGDDSCNSHVGAAGHCLCDAGYQWEDPGNQNDYTCLSIPPREGTCDQPNTVEMDGSCFCVAGFAWCSTEPDDLTCCEDPSQGEPE